MSAGNTNTTDVSDDGQCTGRSKLALVNQQGAGKLPGEYGVQSRGMKR